MGAELRFCEMKSVLQRGVVVMGAQRCGCA